MSNARSRVIPANEYRRERWRNGAGWTRVASGTTNDLSAISGTGPSDLWAVGAGGATLHFDGTRWSAIESGTAADLASVFAIHTDDVWAVGRVPGTGGVIRHWDGTRWSAGREGWGGDRWLVWASGPNDVWVDGVLHWDGQTWSAPPRPNDFEPPNALQHLIAKPAGPDHRGDHHHG